ncbi:hypothetical protein ACHAXR_010614 [Thalassiosira sp. AJA248-18]
MSRVQSPFDPFYIQDHNDRTPTSSRGRGIGQNGTKSSTLEGVVPEGKSPKPLPPRLNVRLILHEEVSSSAVLDPEGDVGSLSQVSIEGKVTARVESSNANFNSPFSLHISGPMASLANITCNKHCVLEGEDEALNTPFLRGGNIGTVQCKVDIPKSEVAGCELFTYSMNTRTQNMPILVQTKSAIQDKTCRISVQIRSNLSNQGDLSNFTIIVAIPTTLKGDTLNVTRGDHGLWDANKRIVTWKIGNLLHGESCLVSAEAEIASAVATLLRDNPFDAKVAEKKIQCPVLVRCLSEVDQVSDLALSAMAIRGDPATIVQHQMRSYQLLHRVGTGA